MICLFQSVYGCTKPAEDNLGRLCALHWEQLAPYAKDGLARHVPAHWNHGVSRWPKPCEPRWWSLEDMLAWERGRQPLPRIRYQTPDGWRSRIYVPPATQGAQS